MNGYILMFIIGAIVGLLSTTKYMEAYLIGWAVFFATIKIMRYLYG